MTYEGSESAWDNFGKFIYQFRPETKTLIRKLEKILNKFYRQNLYLLFNETCLNEWLLPNYTYFKIHDPAAHPDTDTQKYHCSLVKRQINHNIYIYIYTQTHLFVYIYIYTPTHINIRMKIYMYTHRFTCEHMYIYI